MSESHGLPLTTRRSFLKAGTALVGLSPLLTSCRGSDPSAASTLNVAFFGTQQSADLVQRATAAAFEKAHPGVRVRFTG